MAIPANHQPVAKSSIPVGSRDRMVEKKKTPPAKIGLWAGIGVVVVVLGILAGPSLWKQHCASRDVGELAFALEKFQKVYGRSPKGNAAAIAAVLTGKNPEGQDSDKTPIIEASPHEFNAAGEFIDPWGHAYVIEVSPSVAVYSFGSNGQDEQGKGDDIKSWK